jgi:proteasome beta subunit
MVKSNLSMAMQGLAVVPMFAGWDVEAEKASIFSFDITGSTAEETSYHSIGSGSIFAKGALKKRFRADLSEADAVRVCVDALYDAADDDTATGGPDLTRKIYPVVVAVTADGFRRYTDDEVGPVVEAIVADRMTNPGG